MPLTTEMYPVHYVRSFKAAATVRTGLHRILHHGCGGEVELEGQVEGEVHD